jgi:7-carboxy-7-deazaguanine synthase
VEIAEEPRSAEAADEDSEADTCGTDEDGREGDQLSEKTPDHASGLPPGVRYAEFRRRVRDGMWFLRLAEARRPPESALRYNAAVLRVNEIFHSIQGESTHAGRPCVFVRLTGCNLRCTWCDTAYAFREGQVFTVDEVLERVRAYDCPLVELTGGEPLLQSEAIDLMRALISQGHEVLLETGGSLPIEHVPDGVRRIIDVKCPGSGESERNRWENFEALRAGDELKFVIANRVDYDWAVEVLRSRVLHEKATVLFSAVHERLPAGELARWVLDDGLPVRLQIQVHKILWPAMARGV